MVNSQSNRVKQKRQTKEVGSRFEVDCAAVVNRFDAEKTPDPFSCREAETLSAL
jgi:hypothetical protein